jgi:hypothetical protein
MIWLVLLLIPASIFAHFALGAAWVGFCEDARAWWGFPAAATGAVMLFVSLCASLFGIGCLAP